jgi:hypothetical protein
VPHKTAAAPAAVMDLRIFMILLLSAGLAVHGHPAPLGARSVKARPPSPSGQASQIMHGRWPETAGFAER